MILDCGRTLVGESCVGVLAGGRRQQISRKKTVLKHIYYRN